MPSHNPQQNQDNPFAELKKDLWRAWGEFRESIKKKKDDALALAIKEFTQKLAELSGRFDAIIEGYAAYHALRDQEVTELKIQIEALREEVDKLSAPPNTFAIFSHMIGEHAVVYVSGRKMKVAIHPSVQAAALRKGQEVVLNDVFNIIEAAQIKMSGEVVKAGALPENGRIRIVMHLDETKMAAISDALLHEKISIGDFLLYDPQSEIVLEKLAKEERRELFLEEIPRVTYEQIGGLRNQIKKIRRKVEFSFVRPDLIEKYKRTRPKGILLYGPPGCGKTLIAKAIARNIADRLSEKLKKEVQGFFLAINGPELLNKYVGESERSIREIFRDAKNRATHDCPVVIFFDEADSLFRTRGSGISSDVESTIVPQFLSILDGVEELKNILVILASNRQDLIDPAILRPGRIDVKIHIDRPDREEAREILSIHLSQDLPVHKKYIDPTDPKFDPVRYQGFANDHSKAIAYIIEEIIRRIWATDKEPYVYRDEQRKEVKVENKILELTFENGEKETLYLKDFVSGAMLKNIVERGAENASIREDALGPEEGGILTRDFCLAVEQEMSETKDLPNIGKGAQEWLEAQGRQYQKVVHVRPLLKKTQDDQEKRDVETISPGHYF